MNATAQVSVGIQDDDEFEQALSDMLCESDEGIGAEVKRCSSFEESGVLTTDRGLVVKLLNGREFQVTIVRSR